MHSGRPEPIDPARRGRRRAGTAACAWLVAGLVLLLAALPARAAFDLPALMAVLAQRKSGEARFTEERTVSGFDTPLRSSGRLSFAAPDRFARFTELPRPESMQVQGNELVLERGGRTRRMSLDAVPELSALADALRGTLNGDATTLQKHFRAAVEGSAERWVLQLVPADTRLGQTVRRIEIAGLAGDVRSIELQLAGGDHSLMLIDPPTPAAAPSAVASSGPAPPAPR